MKTLFLMVALTLATSAQAGWFAKTPQEDAMCQARIYAGHDTSDRDNWKHMHHYCDCLRFMNRAYLTSDQYERRHALNVAVGGCRYVLSHAKPDFYMRPEIMTQMAIGQRMLGQQAQAAAELLKAIQFNPDYGPAYAELADYYRDLGDKKSGLEMATEGLKHEPDSTRLKRLYTELGGKQPYPEPISKIKPTEQVKAMPQGEIKSETKADEQASVSRQTPPNAAPATTAPEPQKIGKPGNPYCRFCPPDLDPPAKKADTGE